MASSNGKTVELTRVRACWKDATNIPFVTYIADVDTEGTDIDNEVFFCGMSRLDIEAVIGVDFGEDFIIQEAIDTELRTV